MTKERRRAFGFLRTAGAIWLAALVPLVLVTAGCGSGGDSNDEEERPVSAPPRLSVENGRTAVKLDAETLARSGVKVEELRPATHEASATAYGTVLDLTGLAELRGAFTAAQARLEKARAALSASRAEAERLKTLYADQRNASLKALEEATAAAEADAAEVNAAEAALAAQRATGRQRWGEVIAGWAESGSPQLDDLLRQKERLFDLTLPPGSKAPAAGSPVTIQAGGEPGVEARVVSLSPRVDPRFQGVSFLCSAPANSGMLPGTSITAHVPAGPASAGVAVPASAVVWWQGRAWVYVEMSAGTFARREVATDAPLPDGWFVSTGLAPGDRLVVRGAQVLLSEEGRGAVRGSEG